jgi:hypothetical protein
MRVKMRASMRTLTRKGIVLLARKTKEASRAYEKAFLSPLTAQVAAGNIIAALNLLPRSEAASEVWEVGDLSLMVYRDSIFLVAQEMTKTLAREMEWENNDAAADTQEQLDEVMKQLRLLGDQRDLFEEPEDEEEGDKRQLEFAGAGAEDES